MSLKVIVADDEFFIRQRLKKIIPWDELDLIFTGEAENGEEAIQLLEEKKADILILDIKMPKKSGLDVAKYIFEQDYSIGLILLSGYSEFEYAQQALRYNVNDYLVKPINQKDLIKSLNHCKQKLLMSRKRKSDQEEYSVLQKKTDFYNFIMDKLNFDTLKEKYPEMTYYDSIIIIGFYSNQKADSAIEDIKNNIDVKEWGYEYFKENDHSYTLTLFFRNSDRNEKNLTDLRRSIKRYLHRFKGYMFTASTGILSLDADLVGYYREILNCLYNRYFYPESTLLFISHEEGKVTDKKTLSQIRSNLLYHLNSKDAEAFKEYIQTLFDSLKELRSPKAMFLIITEIFVTYHIHYESNDNADGDINQFVKSIIDEEYSLDNLKSAVLKYGLKYSEKNDTLPSDVNLSKKLMAYIDKNYTDQDLSVSGLAAYFQLNASYMGSIFKKVTNQSLIQYITTARMEKAKELLEKNIYKISEIANMVGYSDVFYYSKRFKKYYGCSPKDYSLRVQKKKYDEESEE